MPIFQKNDKVAFVGNSITHSGMYHEYIYLFHLTRYPYSDFHLENFGVAGDVASGGIYRWHDEVAPVSPNITTLMFGMNDIERWLYTSENNGKVEINERKLKAIEKYEFQMDSLIDLVKQSGSHVVLLTPSIYEQNTSTSVEMNYGVNDGLGILAKKVRNLSERYQTGLVDFYKEMNAFNERFQSVNSTFSIIGNDRVHPDREGHFLMAYLYLKGQNHQPSVSKISINAKNQEGNCTNCSLSNLEFDDEISFNAMAYSLPFPIDDEVKEIASQIPFQQDLNQELLIVENLKTGNYILWIDEEEIGEFSSTQLQLGVNLANYQTPQYRQAEKLFQVNKARRELVSDSLRTIKMVEFFNFKEVTPPYDLEEAKQVLDKSLKKIEGESYYDWVKSQNEKYLKIKPIQEELEKTANMLYEKLWEMNEPKNHHYRIIKVE